MGEFVPDSSGINSLGGFSYQIRVFVLYMLYLKDNMQIEFETLDDVNIKNLKPSEIDDNNEKFISKVIGKNTNIAIQVKRTDITEKLAQKVLLNWLLLESSGNVVTKYILVTDQLYNNEDILFNKSSEELFKCVKESENKANAIITKVKNEYKDDFNRFEEKYNSIKDKHEFVSLENIDNRIDEGYSELFRKRGVKNVVYYNRIKELLSYVTVNIMESVNNKKPYVFSICEFMALVEEICDRIKEEMMNPIYSDFKKLHKIDFEDLEVANSREYKQLVACKLPQYLIEQHLVFCGYYENLRFSYMEVNRISKIQDIEETTYENFQNVKFGLQQSGQDVPYNRLEHTKKQSNSYAENEQLKYGSSIFLTKDEMGELQISWEDKENEKS